MHTCYTSLIRLATFVVPSLLVMPMFTGSCLEMSTSCSEDLSCAPKPDGAANAKTDATKDKSKTETTDDKPDSDAAEDKPDSDAAEDKPDTDAAEDKPDSDAAEDKPDTDAASPGTDGGISSEDVGAADQHAADSVEDGG